MRNISAIILSVLVFLTACRQKETAFDASGSFEADEVIVSSQLNGQLLTLNVNEGDSMYKGQVAGTIDSQTITLQKQQVEASIRSLSVKTADVAPQLELLQSQLAVQQTQLDNLLYEKARVERLVKADAATGKQLDDVNAQTETLRKQMEVTTRQMAVQRTNTALQNRSIMSEGNPLRKQAAQLGEQLSKSTIINPVSGIVITKYAEQGEVTAPGKALYGIADLSVMTLRAYVTGNQLAKIKLNQQVKVLTDDGKGGYRTYSGTIKWVSDKAEFTPKTIQTKEERANLVYAVKIKVPNDGFLKMGMYGEVVF